MRPMILGGVGSQWQIGNIQVWQKWISLLFLLPAFRTGSGLNSKLPTCEPELARHEHQALIVIRDWLPGFLPLIQHVRCATLPRLKQNSQARGLLLTAKESCEPKNVVFPYLWLHNSAWPLHCWILGALSVISMQTMQVVLFTFSIIKVILKQTMQEKGGWLRPAAVKEAFRCYKQCDG